MKFPTGGEACGDDIQETVYADSRMSPRPGDDDKLHHNRLIRSESVTNSKVWMKEEMTFCMRQHILQGIAVITDDIG